jgi:hypothetical protein
MGKAKATANIDELVKQALLKLALADGEMKLTGKGGTSVFTTASGTNKEVIARLRNEGEPLITERVDGKIQTVTLTTSGIERVIDLLPADKVGPVVLSVTTGLSPSARVIFLQEMARKNSQALADLVPILDAAVADEKIESELRVKEAEKQRKAEAASLAALERWKILLQQRKKLRIEGLKRELSAEGEDIEASNSNVPTQSIEPSTGSTTTHTPNQPEDIGFRRNIARRLVSSWVDAWNANKPDAREFLESAIWNVSGFRVVGEVDQRLHFDGRYHEGGTGLFTNDIVRIVRPGWVLEEGDDREYVVLKAQVAK